MPLGYGSGFAPERLTSAQVADAPVSQRDLSSLSWILMGLEIAISFTPGLGIIGTTAIAAGGTAAQLGIEYAETGDISPTSLGVGLGGVALPGVIHGIALGRKTYKINAAVNQLRAEMEGRAFQAFGSVRYANGMSATEAYKLTDAERDLIAAISQARGVEASSAAEYLRERGAIDSIDAAIGNSEKMAIIEKPYGASTNMWDYWVAGPGIDIEALNRPIELYGKTAAAGTRGASSAQEQNQRLSARLAARYGLTAFEVGRLLKLISNGKILNNRAWFNILRKSYQRTGNKVLGKLLQRTSSMSKNLLFQQLKRGETIAMFASRLTHKGIGVGNKVMGYIASPSSLVGELVSKTIGKLSSKWEKIGEKLGEKISKIIAKGAKGAKQLEEEFEKNGGKLLQSTVIMGYKPLNVKGIMNTILIQFKPIPTNHKRPVVATLSDMQLRDFIGSPSKMRWYLDHIAHARNGHPHNSVINDGGDLMDYLGFLPSEKISEVLSIVSASKGMANSLKANTSIFDTQYWSVGLGKAFVSALITEAGKLVGNTFTGGGEILKTTIEDSVKGVIRGVDIQKSFGEGFKGAFKQDAKRRFEKEGGRNVNKLRGKIEPLKGIKGAFQ